MGWRARVRLIDGQRCVRVGRRVLCQAPPVGWAERCEVIVRLLRSLPTVDAFALRVDVMRAGGALAGAPMLLWEDVGNLAGPAVRVRDELLGR